MSIGRNLYCVFIAVVTAACSSSPDDRIPGDNETIPVEVARIEQEVVNEPVYASGTFTSDDEVIRSFKTGGVVQRLYVMEGDAIKTGQLLATLDLTEISAQVAQARLAHEKAKRDYERVKNLYRDSVVTLEMFENAGTALEFANEQLTAALFNQAYSEIRATENGFVLKKFVNEGQVVGPGTPVFMTNGAADGHWILKVAVSDGQWSTISIGDAAVILTDVGDDRPLMGHVSKKSEGVDPYSGTFTLNITPVPGFKIPIASGMFGKATITPSIGRKVWKIPYDALLDGDGNKGFVFTSCNQKMAMRQLVSIAGLYRDFVMIDKGLENCNAVIISGNAYLKDRSPIRIIR
ncbi:MAG TPA: efflux RND transporter periplasmic adaptor subunit [Bacteroidales bacterium]|nr:efflux RND transporter periplasmic adaptor subunit [Bacteroidales bacterium]